MGTRDPRVDPRPGDVLRLGHHGVYRVLGLADGGVIDTPIEKGHSDYGESLINPIELWRSWAARGYVIERASDDNREMSKQ